MVPSGIANFASGYDFLHPYDFREVAFIKKMSIFSNTLDIKKN